MLKLRIFPPKTLEMSLVFCCANQSQHLEDWAIHHFAYYMSKKKRKQQREKKKKLKRKLQHVSRNN